MSRRLTLWIAAGLSALLLCVLWPVFTARRSLDPSPWMKQGSSLSQLGIVLRACLVQHDDHIPESIESLRAWSASIPEFTEAADTSFWWFLDPESGAKMAWGMSRDEKGPLVYSPGTFFAEKTGVETRLILSESDTGAFHYEFVDEEGLRRRREEASRRQWMPLVPIADNEEAASCQRAAKRGDMEAAARLVRWFEDHHQSDQAMYWRTRGTEARNSGIVSWPPLPPPFSRYYIYNEDDVLQSEKAAELGDLEAMKGLANWYREHDPRGKFDHWAERRMEEMRRRGLGQVQRATK
jgi:hypothetical protein